MAGTIHSQIVLPNYSEIEIQATPQDNHCSISQEGKIEFSYNGNPDLNTLSIQIKSPVLNYNYFNTWQNLSSGAGNATVNIEQAGTYEYTIFGTPVSGATSNTNICELDSGTCHRNIRCTQSHCGPQLKENTETLGLLLDLHRCARYLFIGLNTRKPKDARNFFCSCLRC